MFRGLAVQLHGCLRHKGAGSLDSLRMHQLPDMGSRSQFLPLHLAGLGGAMGCAQTRQGQQLHGCPLPQNGLAVFDPQNVVGRLQQIRSTGAQCFGGCGTGGGKGQAAFQLAAQRRRERRTAQRGSRCLQGGGLRGFGTERKGIAPQRGQQMYPGSGKLFCAGVGIGRRQRHHQVRPGSQRCAHPHSFRQDGYPTALHNAGAHAHRDGAGPPLPQHAQLQCVAAVERVILCNDADKIHIVYP